MPSIYVNFAQSKRETHATRNLIDIVAFLFVAKVEETKGGHCGTGSYRLQKLYWRELNKVVNKKNNLNY